MENSSPSTSSAGSPIVYPRNAFWWLSTLGAVAGVAVIFVVVIVAGGVAYALHHPGDVRGLQRALTGMYGVVAQGVAELIVIAYILWVLPRLAKVSLAGIGFRAAVPADWPKIAVGIVAMFLIVTVVAGVITNVLHFKNQELAIAIYLHAKGFQKVLFVFFGVLIAPIAEECIFRLLLFNAFKKWFGVTAGVILSGLLFGLAHVQSPFVPAMYLSIVLPLVLAGIVLALVYQRTGKAWASMLVHAGFNALTFIAITAAPQLAK